jgi:hypothetical protein
MRISELKKDPSVYFQSPPATSRFKPIKHTSLHARAATPFSSPLWMLANVSPKEAHLLSTSA